MKAGIGIAVAVVILGVIGAVIFFLANRRKQRQRPSADIQVASLPENRPGNSHEAIRANHPEALGSSAAVLLLSARIEGDELKAEEDKVDTEGLSAIHQYTDSASTTAVPVPPVSASA